MHSSCLEEQGDILWEQPPIPTHRTRLLWWATPCLLPPFHKVSLGVTVTPLLFLFAQAGSLTQVHDTLWAAETTQEGGAGA